MISILRVILPILGVIVIIFQFFHLGDVYRGMDHPIWGFLLGIGLIISPFTAILMLMAYILMVGIPLGLGFLGAYIWVSLFGKGAWAIIGFIIGGWVGYKIVISNSFEKLLEPFRALEKKADENNNKIP